VEDTEQLTQLQSHSVITSTLKWRHFLLDS